MAEKKAIIKNADMSEDMQQDAIDCAAQAMEKFNVEKDIAACEYTLSHNCHFAVHAVWLSHSACITPD